MAKLTLNVNGKTYTVDVAADTPVLWVLRDSLKLTGTKFGCGMAQCGSCTILLDGVAVRSCTMPVSMLVGRKVITIEGVAESKIGAALQKAWLAEDVPQCGYCQSGQIMAAVALLSKNPHPGDQDINAALNGQLCRCGTYQRIRKAIHLAAAEV